MLNPCFHLDWDKYNRENMTETARNDIGFNDKVVSGKHIIKFRPGALVDVETLFISLFWIRAKLSYIIPPVGGQD